MRWPITAAYVATVTAAVALYAARAWTRVKIAEVATVLTRVRLEHESGLLDDIPEVER